MNAHAEARREWIEKAERENLPRHDLHDAFLPMTDGESRPLHAGDLRDCESCRPAGRIRIPMKESLVFIRRRLTALFSAVVLSLGLLGGSALPVSAAFPACPTDLNYDNVGAGTTYVKVYEMQNYNSGASDANYGILCLKAGTNASLSLPDLKLVPYTNDYDPDSPKRCDGQLITSYGTWNDCIGSMRVSIDCHHSVTMWADANYTGTIIAAWTVSGSYSIPALNDNRISSIKIAYKATCATSAEG